jgi:hypothetical protein
LDPALLLDRRLFDGNHLAFHLGEFSGRLLVAANQECGRPENHHGSRGGSSVFRMLAVLGARERRGTSRYGLRFLPKLLARE